MPRPMTAADRTPEVGDVLYSGNGYEYIITSLMGFAGVWYKRVFTSAVVLPEKWRYRSRADGGPVEVED